ncbi:hypothetical protein AVEN_51353-1 [Araneus ventricosus]|uniref:Serpin domain-containing protein n=1 Tax=Araneus ventricosus TaxID=182803 RepID=A0A4Y2IAY2_ARAVE|nr:hypothetical protein AVEN_51353-1 [Araneus ventricosus]
MGLNRVFIVGANLNGITDTDLFFLSEANHKVVLVVNEEGNEAIAVAFKVLALSRALMKKPKITIDHLFKFVIYNTENNLILFTGTVDEL